MTNASNIRKDDSEILVGRGAGGQNFPISGFIKYKKFPFIFVGSLTQMDPSSPSAQKQFFEVHGIHNFKFSQDDMVTTRKEGREEVLSRVDGVEFCDGEIRPQSPDYTPNI